MCKDCHKGLCEACAADVGNGLACKGKCERQVIATNEMIRQGQRYLLGWGPVSRRSNVLIGLLGLALLGYGIFLIAAGQFVLGVPIAVFSLFLLFVAVMSRNEETRYKRREGSGGGPSR
jgi:hypothetical protein